MKTSPFKYQIINIQDWNNKKEVHNSYHKTLKSAERTLKLCEKGNLESMKRTKDKIGNSYKIQTL